MFGLKTKKKQIIKTKKVQSPSPKTTTVEKVVEPVKEEKKFNLSRALGKTEEKMENDFYVFQIKEFMRKVGLFVLLPINSLSSLESGVISAWKYLPSDVLITPSVHQKLVDNDSKVLKSACVSVLIDFPFGQSSFKARKSQVNVLKNQDVKSVIVSCPTALDGTFTTEKDKSQTEKTVKKLPCAGVLIGAEQGEDAIKKTMTAFRNIKMQSFTLSALNLTGEALLNAVRCALECKGDKNLFVISNVDSAEALGEITALGVDRVYTPFVEKIGEELTQKFSVTL